MLHIKTKTFIGIVARVVIFSSNSFTSVYAAEEPLAPHMNWGLISDFHPTSVL